VVLRVKDTGVGIAPDMLPHIFDLFAQESQTLARSRGGLGLGLTIARSLVSLHGGTISAESDGSGHGATFTIRLPHATPSPVREGASPDSASRRERDVSAGLRVLVVDDNEDAAEMLAELLQHLGCTVRTVNDGPAALELVGDFRPEVALLDIGLPVMDGYELARRLTLYPGLEALRLVAVTGYGQSKDRERSAAAGFHVHLVKPLGLAQLRDTLKQLSPHFGEQPPPVSTRPTGLV
jgi:CheY-like chemotaxis protein